MVSSRKSVKIALIGAQGVRAPGQPCRTQGRHCEAPIIKVTQGRKTIAHTRNQKPNAKMYYLRRANSGSKRANRESVDSVGRLAEGAEADVQISGDDVTLPLRYPPLT